MPPEPADADRGDAAAGTSLLARRQLLAARLAAAPEGPGVYVFRDRAGRVLYVGKSQVLRSRLRSYFTAIAAHPRRTQRLVAEATDFAVIPCASSREALILENTLIKRHHPRFNVRLKDDKAYLYFRLPQPPAPAAAAATEPEQRLRQFPRPGYTRRLGQDGARYFGPHTDAGALRTTVRQLRTIFPFRGCGDSQFRRGRICLDYHLGLCLGPCEDRVAPAAYAELLDEVAQFMGGRTGPVVRRLRREMAEASHALDFERAGRLRDRLRAAERLEERQVVAGPGGDADCLGFAQSGSQGMAAILTVRQGRLLGLETHALEGLGGVEPADALQSFVGQHYARATRVPATILVPFPLPDVELLTAVLTEQRGGPVRLRTPLRGALRELMARAAQAAATAQGQAQVAADYDAARTAGLLEDLGRRLGLAAPPARIEGYDISNTMGTSSVGSMVVFEGGRPRPAHYRIFNIQTVTGANDVASLQEVVRRRFRHLAQDRGAAADPGREATAGGLEGEGGADPSFGVLPDLVIVDGGRGQVNAAALVLAELGLEDLALFGLAKRLEEVIPPGRGEPIRVPVDSDTLFLLQRLRDEAHRFAITRHRARRTRAARASRLDGIRGLGPKRRRALLRQFGSVDALRLATVDDLTAVPGVTRSVALAIKEVL
ncbi:MAG TPA: excinuclease ABC subunit UvrC [Candidatus Micrarchaeia archaeon]|nr:excinuclease ABC subunit UvrC [Candidatus Micrarchaeia archaeon]